MLSRLYVLIEATRDDFFPVASVALSNDSVRKKDVIGWLNFAGTKKEYPAYPAVKIARLGVNRHFQRRNIGTHLVNMIKKMFITNNRTGCRFITVDAYNRPSVISFYQANDFQFLTGKDQRRDSRAMFFDLKRLVL